jgi:hypothetical protein
MGKVAQMIKNKIDLGKIPFLKISIYYTGKIKALL